ncbi:O-antigen ligase family protein [Deinococcus aestuarii]|uniref:O-antigen ligase family protein n=1 Tax=Deinococcus aestuarii TaxID=2774531 RepID=UPI001C0BD3F9|nr:O-antigen ligase family protein [Deinococcus aestuarii]
MSFVRLPHSGNVRLFHMAFIGLLPLLLVLFVVAQQGVDSLVLLLLLASAVSFGLVMWRWELGLFLLVAMLPFEASFIVGGFRDGMKLLTGVTFVSLIFKALRTASVREKLVQVMQRKLTLLLLTLVAWSCISMLWAVNPGVALQRSITFLGVLLLFIMVAALEARLIKRMWLVGILSGVAAVVGAAAAGGAAVGRFTAASEDPNEFAGLVLILAAFLSYGGVFRRFGTLRWILVAVLLIGALLTQSRTGLIALAAAPLLSAIILTFSGTRVLARTLLPYALLVALVVGVLSAWPEVTAPLVDRYSTLSNYQSADTWAGRLGIWQGGLQMVAHYPWLGVGAGNFAVLSPEYSLAAAHLDFLRPGGAVAHNMFLSILAELGVVGLVLFVAILFKAIRTAYSLSQRSQMATACLVSLLVYFVMGSTLSWEYSKLPFLLLGSVISLSICNESYRQLPLRRQAV